MGYEIKDIRKNEKTLNFFVSFNSCPAVDIPMLPNVSADQVKQKLDEIEANYASEKLKMGLSEEISELIGFKK